MSLADFLAGYPPLQDGLVQLRLYLAAPGQPLDRTAYDTADIRVDGNRWTLVDGGDGPCTGTGTSLEEQVLPASSLTPQAAPAVSAAPAASGGSSAGSGGLATRWVVVLVAAALSGGLVLARRRPRHTSE